MRMRTLRAGEDAPGQQQEGQPRSAVKTLNMRADQTRMVQQ